MSCQICLKDYRSLRCKSCSKKGILNPIYGKKFKRGQEFKNKMRIKQTGTSNSNWKGDAVGYLGLHTWINKYKTKPSLCESCQEKPPYDLANISGLYKRDLIDWEYLCRRCHMLKDGRLAKAIKRIQYI